MFSDFSSYPSTHLLPELHASHTTHAHAPEPSSTHSCADILILNDKTNAPPSSPPNKKDRRKKRREKKSKSKRTDKRKEKEEEKNVLEVD